MHTIPAYERDPYLTELEAMVLRTGSEQGRPYAVLDDSVLFPEGGGQPSDRGFLNDTEVLEVLKQAGEIRHMLASPMEPGPVQMRLDWPRRFDHMQQHTAQHLITALAQDRLAWETTAFHLGETVSDIELAAPILNPDDLEVLEEAVAAEIRAARAVTSFRVSEQEFRNLKVRTRGLPEGHSGDIRLVEIEGIDLNTCGGTHLHSTAEMECVKLLGTEPLRGGTRLFFVAGGRVRRRLGEHEHRNLVLRTILAAPDEGLVQSAETKLEQLRVAEKRARALEEDMAGLLMQSLAAGPEPLAEHHFDGRDAAFLQQAMKAFLSSAPHKLLFLTAQLEEQSWFLLAAGASLDLDIAAAGREICSLLEGRGGGSGRIFQGKIASLQARDQAIAHLRQALQ